MDVIVGIKFKDFIIIAADMTTFQSIMVLKHDENKIYKLSDRLVMAASGDKGDTTQFVEYVAKNVQLYRLRNGYELSPKGTASFTRDTISQALRARNSYKVNLMIAGFDEFEGPKLFFIDFYATMAEVPYAAHGFGGMFTFSIMDRYYSCYMSREAAYKLLKKCIHEIQQRLFANLPSFKVQIVDKNGIHDLPPITAADLAAEGDFCAMI